MTDRIVRSGILSSERVCSLSWAAEVFYRRLMSVADDFGRFDGRLTILRVSLYPLQIDKVSDSDVGKWRLETAKAGLVRVYAVDGKEYVEIVNFGQRMRAEKSKWPAPVGVSDQPLATVSSPPSIVSECPQPAAYTETDTESDTESETKKMARGAPSLSVADLVSEGLPEPVAAEFLAHRKRKKAVLTPLAWRGFKAEVGKAGWTLAAAVEKSISRGWTGFEAAWVAGDGKPSRLATPAAGTDYGAI